MGGEDDGAVAYCVQSPVPMGLCGALMPYRGAVGHGGYDGTGFWHGPI